MKRLTIHNTHNLLGDPFAAAFLTKKLSGKFAVGEEVQLETADNQDLMYAEIQDAWTGPIAEVPALILEQSNDPLQRTFSGLYTYLTMTTGERLSMEEPITVVVMKGKESTLIRPSARQIKNVGKG